MDFGRSPFNRVKNKIMDKKIITIVAVIVLVMGMIIFLGNGIREGGIYGTWELQGDEELRLEISPDGKLLMIEEWRAEQGTWSISENDLFLFNDRGRKEMHLRIRGNKLFPIGEGVPPGVFFIRR